MKKKRIVLLSFLAVCAVALSACLFDSDDTALNRWLADQGLPDSYRVQTLSVDGLLPVSANAYRGNTVLSAAEMPLFGTQAGISHDLVFDVALKDSAFFAELSESDSAAAFIKLFIVRSFYSSKSFPSDSLPYEETLDLKLEWKLDVGKNKKFVDSIADIPDSTWRNDLKEWTADNSADTTYDISIGSSDTLVRIDLPTALLEDLKQVGPACHLQLRMSAPESKRAYRFYGTATNFLPELRVKTLSDTNFMRIPPFRMSEILTYNDTCDDCLLLHGGVFDSIVVEYPTEKILEALSDFYGDEFPFGEGDGYDVRQAVVLATMNFVRDDSEGIQELGLPIQVVVGSYLDSLGEEIRRMEKYKVDRKRVAESGHPNMVFFEGDSLSLQVTYGMRDFINQAKDGRNFKMMVRLGYPVVRATDSLYNTSVMDDSTFAFLSYFDYARYDFGKTFSQPATLKLWLATKRGGEE